MELSAEWSESSAVLPASTWLLFDFKITSFGRKLLLAWGKIWMKKFDSAAPRNWRQSSTRPKRRYPLD